MSFSSTDQSVVVHRHTVASPWTYALLDAYQRLVATDVRAGRPGKLILSEVSPVITLGRRPCTEDLTLGAENLRALGIDTYASDRGGRATYHGPGQWVLFAVESLEVLTGDRRGVRKAVEALLEIARSVAKEYDSSAEIYEGTETGVWVTRGSGIAKVASVGVHIEQGVLLHGVAVNGYRTSTSFQGLKPCGLERPVAFLLEDSAEFSRLGDKIIREACSVFTGF